MYEVHLRTTARSTSYLESNPRPIALPWGSPHVPHQLRGASSCTNKTQAEHHYRQLPPSMPIYIHPTVIMMRVRMKMKIVTANITICSVRS